MPTLHPGLLYDLKEKRGAQAFYIGTSYKYDQSFPQNGVFVVASTSDPTLFSAFPTVVPRLFVVPRDVAVTAFSPSPTSSRLPHELLQDLRKKAEEHGVVFKGDKENATASATASFFKTINDLVGFSPFAPKFHPESSLRRKSISKDSGHGARNSTPPQPAPEPNRSSLLPPPRKSAGQDDNQANNTSTAGPSSAPAFPSTIHTPPVKAPDSNEPTTSSLNSVVDAVDAVIDDFRSEMVATVRELKGKISETAEKFGEVDVFRREIGEAVRGIANKADTVRGGLDDFAAQVRNAFEQTTFDFRGEIDAMRSEIEAMRAQHRRDLDEFRKELAEREVTRIFNQPPDDRRPFSTPLLNRELISSPRAPPVPVAETHSRLSTSLSSDVSRNLGKYDKDSEVFVKYIRKSVRQFAPAEPNSADLNAVAAAIKAALPKNDPSWESRRIPIL
jgi:hypothetical protein